MKDEKMYTRWVPMYLNYDEAKLHKDTLTKEEWDGFLDWFWGLGKNFQECMGWILQTESDHPRYFDNIELFEEMFEQYKEELKYELEEQMKENLKERYERTKYWYDAARVLLEGRTIENVWWQEWDEEYPEEGTGLVFVTDKGDAFFVGMDDEGNGPGALHIGTSKERKKELQKKKAYVGCLPVGVESNSSYRDMWKEMHNLNKMSWNEAGHTEVVEVEDDR